MNSTPFTLAPARAARPVVDLQNDFVRAGAPREVAMSRATLTPVAALRTAARAAGMPVIFTRYTAGPEVTQLPPLHPAGIIDERLPVGMQIIGRRYDDVGVLMASRVFDELRPWAYTYDLCRNRPPNSRSSSGCQAAGRATEPGRW